MAATSPPGSKIEDLTHGQSPQDSLNPSERERADPTPPSSEAINEVHPYRWLQILGGMLLQMNSWGLVNTYGVFQAYYTTQLIPHESESKVAWIGSIYVFVMLVGGFLTGPLFDAGYLLPMLVAGTILATFGLMMTSLCHQYWQLMLAQGIASGIGAAFFVVPALAIPPEWYPGLKGRALSLGCVATAASLGGILYPVMFHYIQRDAGWRWAVRAISFVVFGTSSGAVLLLRYKDTIKERRELLDTSLLRERPYLMLLASAWLGFAVIYTPINWMQKYYVAERQNTTSSLIFWLIPIMMASGIPGRLVPNAIAVKFGALNVLIGMTAFCGMLNFCWIAVHSRAAIIVFALVYGFFAGGWIALTPPALLSAAPHQNNIGTRMGMATAFQSLGVLAGLPLAGQILQSTGSYTGTQIFSGVLLLISTAGLFITRVILVGFRFRGPEAKI